jgi:hypothetical protein
MAKERDNRETRDTQFTSSDQSTRDPSSSHFFFKGSKPSSLFAEVSERLARQLATGELDDLSSHEEK